MSKREAIIDAAQGLLARFGARRTSVDDICRRARIAKGTAYLYFKSKEEIVAAVAERLIREMLFRAGAAHSGQGPFEKRVAAILEARFLSPRTEELAFAREREIFDPAGPEILDLFARAERHFVALLVDVFSRAQTQREVDLSPLGIDPSRAAHLLLRLARACASPEAREESISAAEFRQRLGEMLLVVCAGLRRHGRTGLKERSAG